MTWLASKPLATKKADAGVIYTTWNPADKSANLALSNGNLTGTNTSASTAFTAARSIVGSASAKWYYEKVYSNNNIWGGFATSAMDVDNVVSAGALAYYGTVAGGFLYEGTTVRVSSLPARTTFTTLRLAIDLTARKIWLGDESGWWNSGDPSNDANPLYTGFAAGTYYAMASVGDNTASFTADFGQSPAYAVPTGFTGIF